MNQPNPILVFNRTLVRRHRDRAAARFRAHNVLAEETAAHLVERLGDIKRDFKLALCLGAGSETLARHLLKRESAFVVMADISEKMLRQVQQDSFHVAVDEEFLPFAAGSFDLIVSNMNLHWVNDLPGALMQIKNALRKDGLFFAALPGGRTLHELRTCLLDAELSVTSGVSPRLSPTIEMSTASGLLQRAGFALPVTDQEVITLTYPDAFALMRDLRGMGETNAHLQRLPKPTRRAIFVEAARLYHDRFSNAAGRIPATFEILFLHGWK